MRLRHFPLGTRRAVSRRSGAIHAAVATALVTGWTTAPADAAINLFLGGGTPGVWEDGNNWVTGSAPTGTDDVYIDGGNTVTSTTAITFGGELQVGLEPNAYGRGNLGGKATLNIDAGSITMGNKSIVVGQSQYSTANDNSGVLNIAAGATLTQQGFVLIGFFGPLGTPTTGTLNVNGGTFNSTGGGEFRIGGRDGNFNNGSFSVSNGGTVNVTKGVFLGGASNGTMTVSGAGSSFSTTQFISMGTDGANGTSVANLNISGGTINTRELSINEGKSGTCTLTQTGGLVNLDQTGGNMDLQIGRSTNGASALGVYDMSGGTLIENRGNILVASGNNGQFNVSGTAQVTLGAAKSVYLNINNRPAATAVITQSGGNVNLPADSALGISFSALGTTTYKLNGGTLTTPKFTINAGAGARSLNFNGGTLVANGAVVATADLVTTLGSAGGTINTNGNTVTWNTDLGGIGGVTKTGAGKLSLTTSSYGGVTTVQGGTLSLASGAHGTVISGAGGADIQGGSLELDYTGISSPAATVRNLLKAGRDYAVAAGVTPLSTGQLRSTNATAARGLGYKDDGTSLVTIKPALYGDADLDGGVSINDFNALAGSFGTATGKFWADGDFDYDGGVSINDFNLLAGGFGQSLPPTSEVWAGLLAFAAAHDDLDAFAAVTGVPEPTTAGLVAATTALLLRRRRMVVPA